MGDLFRESKMETTPKARLIHAIFGTDEKTWMNREKEASAYMSRYISAHPEELHNAIITPDELKREIRTQMDWLRGDYLHYEGTMEPQDNFAYARQIMICSMLCRIVSDLEVKEDVSFIHLCDKGCEAVRSIRKQRRENNGTQHHQRED